ncbi:MAG: hypothetical protein AAF512_25265, partial [Pseudomonadota bacterium]
MNLGIGRFSINNSTHVKNLMKTFKYIVIFIVVLAIIVTCLAMFTKRPAPLPADSQSAELLKPGLFEVASWDTTLIDANRTTDSNNDYEGSAQRELSTRIWYPQDKAGKLANMPIHPLVVYSHGFSSMKSGGTYIAKQLASHGYIVMAADYPLTNYSAPGGPRVQDVVNQPGDISFMIDTMLTWSKDESSRFYNAVDENRIGAAGLSLGGMTTTLLTYHPKKLDKRVKAAISIAGPSSLFMEKFFTHNDIPFLMIGAEHDALVPYETNAAPIPSKAPNSALVRIAGGSHVGFADAADFF